MNSSNRHATPIDPRQFGFEPVRSRFTVGDRVVRTEGRPANVGRCGTVVRVGSDVIGGGGDIGIVVREDDGTEWFAYDRQLKITA